MTKILHISTHHQPMYDGPKRYIRVYVYDTVDELRKAAGRFSFNPSSSDPNRAIGMFSPPPTKEFYNGKQWIKTNYPHWGGMMRLCKEYLCYEVVTHECFHAACSIYRMDIKTQINLSHGTFEREEQLAYIAGDLCAQLVTKLQTIYGVLPE